MTHYARITKCDENVMNLLTFWEDFVIFLCYPWSDGWIKPAWRNLTQRRE